MVVTAQTDAQTADAEEKSVTSQRSALTLGSIAIISCGAALAAYAALGWYTRWIADDYYFGTLARRGVLTGIVDGYCTGEDGRLASLFLRMLSYRSPVIARFGSAILLGAWIFSLTALLRQIPLRPYPSDSTSRISWRLAAGISCVLVFTTVAGALSPGQSLYWLNGMCLYTVPLVFMTVGAAALIGWVFRSYSPASWTTSAATFVCGFLISACSEIALVLFIATAVGLLLTIIVDGTPRFRRVLPLLGSGITGATVALLTIILSPGTHERLQLLAPHRTQMETLLAALRYTMAWYGWCILAHPGVLLLALIAPAALLPRVLPLSQEMIRKRVCQLHLCTFGLVLGCCLPSAWALSGPPPSRAFVIPQYVLVLALALSGWWVRRGVGFRRQGAWNVVALALFLIPIFSVATTIRKSADVVAFAAAWDAQDRRLRDAAAHGVPSITVPVLPHDKALIRGLYEAGPEEIAEYYGLRSLRIIGERDARSREPWEQGLPGILWYRFKSQIR
jgi:hypothetical protein